MTTPTGPITFGNLQSEFGGSNPISLSEYYRGGAYVGASTASSYGTIASSGAISLGTFRGTNSVVINASLGNQSVGSTRGSASISSKTDGTLTLTGTDVGTMTVTWRSPASAGSANSYYVKLVRFSGSTVSGSTQGAWLPMSSQYTWSLATAPAGQSRSCTCTVQIATDAAGTNIVSQTNTGGWNLYSDNT